MVVAVVVRITVGLVVVLIIRCAAVHRGNVREFLVNPVIAGETVATAYLLSTAVEVDELGSGSL